MKVKSDDEALELINDSRYGLTASIWTNDDDAFARLMPDVEAGTVFQNRCVCDTAAALTIQRRLPRPRSGLDRRQGQRSRRLVVRPRLRRPHARQERAHQARQVGSFALCLDRMMMYIWIGPTS